MAINIVEFDNGKFGVRAKSFLTPVKYADIDGVWWFTNRFISELCMFETQEEVEKVFNLVNLKIKRVIK